LNFDIRRIPGYLKALQGPEGGLVIWKVRRNPNFYLKKYWNALFPRGLP